MTTPAATLSVSAGENSACIRITGRANFTLGVEFRTLVDELQKNDCGYFLLDLSECVLMDSTILGILTSLGLKQQQLHGEEKPSVVELRNPHERVAELIENLGVMSLFKLTHGPLADSKNWKAINHQAGLPTREETTRTCLEAHETLVAANPQNAAKFKDVTHFLAEDLKRVKKPS
jgi:anti-anti-sigma regulatory factor